MDASNWGKTENEITSSKLAGYNWSAFWCFGHGVDEYAWPLGGEWDIAEWLPSFYQGPEKAIGSRNLDWKFQMAMFQKRTSLGFP